MKTPFRQLVSALGTVLVALTTPTLTAHAVPYTAPPTFCETVTTLSSTRLTALQARIASQQSSAATRVSKLTAAQNMRAETVAAARDAAAQAFEEKIAALQDNEKRSDIQLQAITTFKQDVQKAELARAQAVDAARQTYQSNLADILSGQQTALSQSLLVYQAAVQTAFNDAATNCGNEGAAATLKASVKSAREKLQSARNANQVVADIKVLNETRRDAIKDANKTFANSIQTYAATLRDALATDTEQVSPQPNQ